MNKDLDPELLNATPLEIEPVHFRVSDENDGSNMANFDLPNSAGAGVEDNTLEGGHTGVVSSYDPAMNPGALRPGLERARQRRHKRIHEDRGELDHFDAFTGFVLYIAKKYKHEQSGNVHFDDIDQMAFIGLQKAINGFDSEKGRFIDYLASTVRGEIKRYFRDRTWTISPPRHSRDIFTRISQEGDIPQEIEEKKRFAQKVGLSVEELDKGVEAIKLRQLISLHGTNGQNQDANVPVQAETGFDYAEFKDLLTNLFGQSPKTITALRLRLEGYTQSEIGEVIGCSQVEAGRILRRAGNVIMQHIKE